MMKTFVKTTIARFIKTLIPGIFEIKAELYNYQIAQLQLKLHYQQLLHQALPLPKFEDAGFRIYSQCDEDGLLLYIFALIGTTNKMCLDIAFGSPYGANTTNLLCNWGWHGLLIDTDESSIAQSRQFFVSHKDTWIYPPKIINAWITVETINSLLEQQGMVGEIDLFSLDVDGIDYWLWKALEIIQPRVVVLLNIKICGAQRNPLLSPISQILVVLILT